MRVTGTTRPARSAAGWNRSRQASIATLQCWTRPTGRRMRPRRCGPSGSASGWERHRSRSAEPRTQEEAAQMRTERLGERLEALRQQMRELQAMERAVAEAPDRQISLTDPDARAMATQGKGTGMVGYNVQAAVDAEHHLIVAHEVTNVGHDRS